MSKNYLKIELKNNGVLDIETIKEATCLGQYYFTGGIIYGIQCLEHEREVTVKNLIIKCLMELNTEIEELAHKKEKLETLLATQSNKKNNP